MKLLTFLGVANYQPTAYVWDGREHVSSFSPAASCAFLRPEELIVFLTEESQQAHYEKLHAELDGKLVVRAVPVPHGRNEQELWQIFAQVSSAVSSQEEVAFDITNGLRSFPLLGLLAAAFLQNGLGVHLKAVLYGAFDVRDQTATPNRTPMFDLSPMLSLLNWSAAADRFNQTGDARYLATLIQHQRNELGKKAGKDQTLRDQAGTLGSLVTNLTNISQSLRLIRPLQTMEQVEHLPGTLENALPALENSMATMPFHLLMNNVRDAYLPLGLNQPADPANLAANLMKQRCIIRWYVDREQWAQAITLAREWLVNWFIYRLDQQDLFDKELRDQVEERINNSCFQCRTPSGRESIARSFPSIPEALEALDIWNCLVEARNDINHAGMRANPGDPISLIQTIQKQVQRIERLPVPEVP